MSDGAGAEKTAHKLHTADQNDRGHNMPQCQEIRLMAWAMGYKYSMKGIT